MVRGYSSVLNHLSSKGWAPGAAAARSSEEDCASVAAPACGAWRRRLSLGGDGRRALVALGASRQPDGRFDLLLQITVGGACRRGVGTDHIDRTHPSVGQLRFGAAELGRRQVLRYLLGPFGHAALERERVHLAGFALRGSAASGGTADVVREHADADHDLEGEGNEEGECAGEVGHWECSGCGLRSSVIESPV